MPDNNMSATVTVTLSGTYDLSTNPQITAQYSGSTTPDSSGVIGSDGTIDLTKMNKAGYSNVTMITFNLAGSVIDSSDGNKTCTPSYPDKAKDAIVVELAGSDPQDGVPRTWGANRKSGTELTITDPDTDGETYNYTLYAKLNGHKCPVDPSIINRTSN